MVQGANRGIAAGITGAVVLAWVSLALWRQRTKAKATARCCMEAVSVCLCLCLCLSSDVDELTVALGCKFALDIFVIAQ